MSAQLKEALAALDEATAQLEGRELCYLAFSKLKAVRGFIESVAQERRDWAREELARANAQIETLKSELADLGPNPVRRSSFEAVIGTSNELAAQRDKARARITELESALKLAHDENAKLKANPEAVQLRCELNASETRLGNALLANGVAWDAQRAGEKRVAELGARPRQHEGKSGTDGLLKDEAERTIQIGSKWRHKFSNEIVEVDDVGRYVWLVKRVGGWTHADFRDAYAWVSDPGSAGAPVATEREACQWYTVPDLVTGEGTSESCNEPATWRGCEGFTCEKHKCRCAKPIEPATPEPGSEGNK